jgi:hypothetical protein
MYVLRPEVWVGNPRQSDVQFKKFPVDVLCDEEKKLMFVLKIRAEG